MDTRYENIIMANGKKATSFSIQTKKGTCQGLFDKRIWVHAIHGEGSVKGLMDILTRKFRTNKITFTPLINSNVKNSIKGELKICKADNPENPYKEDFEYLECEWVIAYN